MGRRAINTDISDLFFNYNHDAYLALPEDASDEDARAALLESAEMFAGSVGGAFRVFLDPEDLVTDFLARL